MDITILLFEEKLKIKKEIGLKYVLSNIDKTLKEINKNNIETNINIDK
jgi:hypothetical protein